MAKTVSKNMSTAFELILRFLSRMYELASKVKDISEDNQVGPKMLNDYLLEIKSMIEKAPGSIGLKLYLERLYSLTNVKLT